MNWRHIRLIIKREYLDRFRSPSFAIGTALGVIGIIALSFLPQLFQAINQETTMRVVIVDKHNLIYPYLLRGNGLTPTPQPAPDAGTDPQSATLSARILFVRPDTQDLN